MTIKEECVMNKFCDNLYIQQRNYIVDKKTHIRSLEGTNGVNKYLQFNSIYDTVF